MLSGTARRVCARSGSGVCVRAATQLIMRAASDRCAHGISAARRLPRRSFVATGAGGDAAGGADDADSVGAFVELWDDADVDGAPAPSDERPLGGLRFAVKDMYDIVGTRTGFGNPTWLATRAATPATETAHCVAALLAAGAACAGKTHMDELAFSLNGENAHYGTPVNIAAPGRVPGGSSSGSAAAVAAGLVDFALGSDTGGSVRVPASYCGVWGMRPSWGAVSMDGARPLAPSFDTVGWFARDAETLQRVGEVLLDAAPGPLPVLERDSPAAVLLLDDVLALADADVAAAVAEAAQDVVAPALGRLRLEGRGASVLERSTRTARLPPVADCLAAFRTLQMREAWAAHGAWIDAAAPAFGPGVAERFEAARSVSAEEARGAARVRARVARGLAFWLKGNILVVPAAPGPAPLLRTPPAELDSFRQRALSITCLAGLAGCPSITVPLLGGAGRGAPVGLGIIGAPGSDSLLLELARAIEAATPAR